MSSTAVCSPARARPPEVPDAMTRYGVVRQSEETVQLSDSTTRAKIKAALHHLRRQASSYGSSSYDGSCSFSYDGSSSFPPSLRAHAPVPGLSRPCCGLTPPSWASPCPCCGPTPPSWAYPPPRLLPFPTQEPVAGRLWSSTLARERASGGPGAEVGAVGWRCWSEVWPRHKRVRSRWRHLQLLAMSAAP